MTDDAGAYLSIGAFAAAAALGAWTARACFRARKAGVPGADAVVWTGLAVVFLLMAVARLTGWMKVLGVSLRVIAREHHLYANRRPLQIAATVAVAAVALVVWAIGLRSIWDYIRRYRLAVGFTALVVGFATIRFISLHEVDAWIAQLPWLQEVVELTSAAAASAVAVLRVRQLREHARLR